MENIAIKNVERRTAILRVPQNYPFELPTIPKPTISH